MSRSRRAAYLIALLALGVRIAYALSQAVLQDDAVHYVAMARLIAENDWASVDPYWYTPYSLILAGLHALVPVPWVGLSRALCIAVGTATVLILGLAGQRPFGSVAALVAAAILALQQRMVRVATDGHTEGLYILLAVATGLALLHARESGRLPHFAFAGLLLGALFVQRQDAALLVVPALGAVALGDVLSRRAAWKSWGTRLGVAFASAALLTSAYAAVVGPRLNGRLLFGKMTNVYGDQPFTVVLPPETPESGAPELAEAGGSAGQPRPTGISNVLREVAEQYPRELRRVPRAVARALLHPLLPILALVGVWIGWRRRQGPILLALVLALAPLAAYPVATVVDRHFIQIVPWVAVLAAVATAWWLERWRGRIGRVLLLSVLLVPLAVLTAYAAVTRGSRSAEYRDLAHWIDRELGAEAAANGHAPAGELWVVTSAPELDFYSERVRRRRLPWGPDGCALAAWMRSQGLSWLALDRRFVAERMMMGYLPLLDSPDPAGFELVKEIRTEENVLRLLREDGQGCP